MSDSHHAPDTLSRREFLRIGGSMIAGLSVSSLVQASASRPPARNLLMVYLSGGPSHLDLWDPKEGLTDRFASPFASIPTNVPGVRFTQLLPQLAAVNDKFTLIRSMSYCPRGHFHHDAALSEMLGRETAEDFHHSGKRTYGELAMTRWDSAGVLALAESSSAYGTNEFGASLQEAVRRIESGTRIAEVTWPYFLPADPRSWDVHEQLTNRMREHSAPILDRALATMFADLDAAGLLKETLVVVTSEFGRSPERGLSTSGNDNTADGRDHWPYCFSALIGGAGIRRGYVHGTSDGTGAAPVEKPVHPRDLIASIDYALGFERRGSSARGTPVPELFS